ncbi:mechanosensitive ion channel family protein [Bacillus sp. FJAT-29790]|uniref:mechanosensitive ion channel family protein n=1 Tax=Bacillus sp. FJAT-29790 TaxID=1895002 RepID=UPI001C24926D|nr:mechanosensitive ion channel family protein [Bacillus sp. FJAT-29790]MBU8878778.1 mechanosensitive ion channel family protein [Bacillus sp. FJAT-29790]
MSWKLFFSYEFIKDVVISVGIFLLFLLLRKFFAKYVIALLIKWIRKESHSFFAHMFLSFERPIQWMFILLGIYVSAWYFPYLDPTHVLFVKLIKSSIIFVVGWGLFNLSSSSTLLFAKLNERFNFEIDEILIPFVSKLIRVIIVVLIFSGIAEEFNYNVIGFVGGLGLGGLAFALAAKDAIGNLFGGVIIVTEKPFTIGDWILTPSVEGTVETITFRTTRIRTFAQALVTVPNAKLANETITNWSEMGKRRIVFNLSVTYETPKDKLEGVIKQMEYMLKNHSEIHQDTIVTKFDKYGADGLDIYLYFFTKTTVWLDFLKVKEEINFKIMEILDKEGVSLAIPNRKLYVDSKSEGNGKVRSESFKSEVPEILHKDS